MSSSITDKAIEQHGGNMSWLESHYPSAPKPFLDLSTGINPYGYVLLSPERKWNHHLPDIAHVRALQHAMAQYYNVFDAKLVTPASGTQPLMMALAGLRMREYSTSSVGIVSPAYAEHERVWRAMGHDCYSFSNLEEAHYDVVIITNPNNPDGRITRRDLLLQLAAKLAERSGWLIIDESFADLMPELSLADIVHKHDNIVILRSCGKFFGVAGMRVSCAIAPEPCAAWLREVGGPWPVSNVACQQVPAMLKDDTWAQAMRYKLEEDAESWREILAQHFTIVGHTPLFTLVENARAADWYTHLAANGILVRRFDYNTRWLRFGLPDVSATERLSSTFRNGPKP